MSSSTARPMARLAGAVAAWAATGGAVAMVAAAACDDCRSVAQRPRDFAFFAAWLAAVYVAAFAIAGLGVALLSPTSRAQRDGRGGDSPWSWVGAHVIAATVAAVVLAGFRNATATLVPAGHERAQWLRSAAAVLLAAAAAMVVLYLLVAVKPLGRRLAIGLVLAFPIGGLAVLGVTLPTIGVAPASVTIEPPAADRARGPVLVFGVDGADWRRIDALFARGRLPNLAGVVARGSRASLATTRPTWSPIVWTTIATGMAEAQHGVNGFTELRFPGLPCGVQRLPRRVLLRELAVLGTELGFFQVPVTACRVRSKPLWTILTEHSRRVAIVRWWATWPAAPVAGYLISDRSPRRVAFETRELGLPLAEDARITYPTDLLDSLDLDTRELDADALLEEPLFSDLDPARRQALRDDQPLLRLLGQIYASDRFSADLGLALLEREPLDLVAVYLTGVDNFSHRMERYPETVDRYYEYVDGLLGRYIAALPTDATIFVISDHGWDYEPGRRWGHMKAPAGILAAAGTAIVAGADVSPSATIFDLAPTLLAVFGLPASQEMPGRVLEEILSPDALAGVPEARIASYGLPDPTPHLEDDRRGHDWDTETLRRLRALGYLRLRR